MGPEGEKLRNWPFLASGQGREGETLRTEVGRFTSWALRRWGVGIFLTLRQPHPQRPRRLPSQSSPLEPRSPRLLQPAPQSCPQKGRRPSPFSGWIQSLPTCPVDSATGCSFPEKKDTIPLQELSSMMGKSPRKAPPQIGQAVG